MAQSRRQVIRYVRGLVAVVIVSSVALSGAVQAQTADTAVGPSAPQPNWFQPGVVSPSGRASVGLLPTFSQSGDPQTVSQPSRRSRRRGRSDKILAGVAGALLGGIVGVPIGAAMNRNSHSSDRGMAGGLIGFEVGAVIGAVVVVSLVR